MPAVLEQVTTQALSDGERIEVLMRGTVRTVRTGNGESHIGFDAEGGDWISFANDRPMQIRRVEWEFVVGDVYVDSSGRYYIRSLSGWEGVDNKRYKPPVFPVTHLVPVTVL